MRRLILVILALFFAVGLGTSEGRDATSPPIHIAFLWHMHQPIYWPYESVIDTDAYSRYDYSVADIHNQRTGPYTSWPQEAVEKGMAAGMGNFGAQVSFSGSLIENLNNLEGAGNANFAGWKGPWNAIKTQNTSLGNPRMDMVAFGYHHPLMALLDYRDLREQIAAHRGTMGSNFSGDYSKGMFPPENAFSARMIPALVDEGIEWVLVDNVHFDRACAGYPYATEGNLVEPNGADVRNPNPGDWIQLTGLWAPTRVSAQWGHQPHFVEYVDPETGAASRIIAVPADRYMGNEDGRGGFGALSYDEVMSQLEPYNTDPAHPILVVLHHDGDNYGGGTDSYYGHNFQAFVDWLAANPSRFVCTTVEDYLEQFPPDPADVIHAEDGSWSGADNGDPEFKKWMGDPAADGYSPDRNSWAVVTAAKNFVFTADQVDPGASGTAQAWKYLLNAEASDYWYWDGAQDGKWDSHPTRAVNQGIPSAQAVIAGGSDLTGPTVFAPQREPYNPGGTEWTIAQPSDFEVWTYVFDVSGLTSVTLKYRVESGPDPAVTAENHLYAGTWTTAATTASDIVSRTNPLPLYRAQRYGAMITGQTDVLVDYYVEAVDALGHVTRSPIRHVHVGSSSGGGGGGAVSWSPEAPGADDVITVTVAGAGQGANLHWGVNGFDTPLAVYWPAGTFLFNGTGPAVQTPMTWSGDDLVLSLGPFNDPGQAVSGVSFAINYADDSWDNNGGLDYQIPVGGGGGGGDSWVMDGAVDAGAELAATCGGIDLYLGFNGSALYVATQAASALGQDVFLLVSDAPGALAAAPWAKAGQAAAWSAYVGNESDNNWCGWFDQGGVSDQAADAVVEGSLDLAGEFGSVPPSVFVAVGRYQTADGGVLTAQCPTGNGDGNVDAAEFHVYALSTTAVGDAAPVGPIRLSQSFPNPVRRAATITFRLEEPGPVTLRVFDVRGREVRTLADGMFNAGPHAVTFDRANLPGGIYFYRLTGKGLHEARRLVVLD